MRFCSATSGARPARKPTWIAPCLTWDRTRHQISRQCWGEQEVPELPAELLAVRRRMAGQYLRGTGLELGALHSPLEVTGVNVRYVDRMAVADLRRHYPELAGFALTPVDIIDDGEKLSTIPG